MRQLRKRLPYSFSYSAAFAKAVCLLSCGFITAGASSRYAPRSHMMQSFCFRFVGWLIFFSARSLHLLFNLSLPYLIADFSIYLSSSVSKRSVIDKLSSPLFFFMSIPKSIATWFAQFFFSPSFFSCFITISSGIWQDALAIAVHRRCDFCIINAAFFVCVTLVSFRKLAPLSVSTNFRFRCCRFLDTSFKTARKFCHLHDYNWHCILPYKITSDFFLAVIIVVVFFKDESKEANNMVRLMCHRKKTALLIGFYMAT